MSYNRNRIPLLASRKLSQSTTQRYLCVRQLNNNLRKRYSKFATTHYSSKTFATHYPSKTFATNHYSSQRPLATTTHNDTNEQPRINPVGIQYLSNDLHRKVFPTTATKDYLTPPHPALIKLSQSHLKHHGLLGKKTQISSPITIPNFPELVGNNSLDEHFHKIGTKSAQPYLSMAESFLSSTIPPKPSPHTWLLQPGWTRYAPGEPPQSVPYPSEDELVFDVETLYKQTQYACMATAVSSKAWYGWVSPFLSNYASNSSYNDYEHLIPFNTQQKPKLLIGYNVSYDRARVLEEYSIKQSKAYYLDAMALHISVSGICSQQRPIWHKHKKQRARLEALQKESPSAAASSPQNEDDFGASSDVSTMRDLINDDDEISFSVEELANELADDPWLMKGAPNSLANVADFHCGIKMEKDTRDIFATLDPQDIINDFPKLMDYCANDVSATFAVSAKLFPMFREKIPHPVSFAALRHMGTLMLPTTKKWNHYIETAESLYQENRDSVTKILQHRAESLVKFIIDENESLKPDIENDPWYKQLDWTMKQPRLKKNGEPVAKQAFMTGFPEWYRDLFRTPTTLQDGSKSREMKISVRTRITPLLLKLKWEGYPLIWTDSCGWCFKVPHEDKIIESMKASNYIEAKLSEEDFMLLVDDLATPGNYSKLFKVPSPEGPTKRCTSIMSKSYLSFFENGTLTSEYDYAKDILKLNSNASYWMGNRSRIMDQFVVFADEKGAKNKFFETKKELKQHQDMGVIIPKLCTMGTITRRAVENTWLTASNSKSSRIGSELKAMIEAPQGYAFVGADVDSEELWIASLIGDSIFGVHGASALGWMTLEGDKNEKTDLHSKTAEILGISRGDAKIFNYGRIYGAGVRFATRLLKQCNTNLSDHEAEVLAKDLYVKTKGDLSSSRFLERKMYHGGTESIMFNMLESIAYQKDPKTPVLGASITDALTMGNLNKNNYLTSRINWAIQSSGVDYLHLLIVSMDYLVDKYKVNARLIITVHDELRYMCKEEDKYKVALLLQISNLWTRAMFCEQLGMKELPQSCAFFSEVDIDKILRKEVSLDCITPSHTTKIPPGESLDIRKLLEILGKDDSLGNGNSSNRGTKLSTIKYKAGTRVIERLPTESHPDLKAAKAKMQLSIDKATWRKDMNEYILLKKQFQSDSYNHDRKSSSTDTARTASLNAVDQTSTTKLRRSTKKITPEYNLSTQGDALLHEELGLINKLPAHGKYTRTKTRTRSTGAKVRPASETRGLMAHELDSAGSTANASSSSRTISDPEPENLANKTSAAPAVKSGTSRTLQPKRAIRIDGIRKSTPVSAPESEMEKSSLSSNSSNIIGSTKVTASRMKVSTLGKSASSTRSMSQSSAGFGNTTSSATGAHQAVSGKTNKYAKPHRWRPVTSSDSTDVKVLSRHVPRFHSSLNRTAPSRLSRPSLFEDHRSKRSTSTSQLFVNRPSSSSTKQPEGSKSDSKSIRFVTIPKRRGS